MKKTKGLKTQKKVIDAAIKCLTQFGLHQTTFQKIADESNLSQSLVMHYFMKKDDIFPVVWDSIYQEALKTTSTRLQTQSSVEYKIREYINVSWELFNQNEALTKIYIQLYFLSSFDDKLKATNSNVKRVAINRIAEIIVEGQKLGAFNKHINPFSCSKIIHNTLSGFILNGISEFREFDYDTLLREYTELLLNSLK